MVENPSAGWIPHDGGPRPVERNVWLAVQFRGPADPAKGILRTHGYSHVFAWHHDGAEDDIIAYQVSARQKGGEE